MKKVVEANNLNIKYQTPGSEIEAIENLSFSIYDAEFVSIIGPSGCGKSTLLMAIAGIVTPSSGSVFVNGKKAEPKNTAIGYMPQKDCLFEWRTIKSNITLGLEIRKMKTKENLEYADYLLETYGLADFKNKYPSQLSGGMRQRCSLIRTLVIKPDILLLDEAFSALDYQTRISVVDDIYSILRKEKKTAILVTHDIAEGISVSDRIIVLSKRPGTLKKIETIDLKCSSGATTELSPFERRECPEFNTYFNKLWKDIDGGKR